MIFNVALCKAEVWQWRLWSHILLSLFNRVFHSWKPFSMEFRLATKDDADVIGALVMKLTEEISRITNSTLFGIDTSATVKTCAELIKNESYGAIICTDNQLPIAVATFTESYALYAGGKIGIIPEFYVIPEFRSYGVGEKLLSKVRELGREKGWSCIELCTPPLPDFERTLKFYQKAGMNPVGGRKMRQYLS